MPNKTTTVVYLMNQAKVTKNIMEVAYFKKHSKSSNDGPPYVIHCELHMREDMDTINRFLSDTKTEMRGVLVVISPRGRLIHTELGKAICYMRDDDIESKTTVLAIGFDGKADN